MGKITKKNLGKITSDLCGKEFNRKAGLKAHVENIQKGIKIKCDFCGKDYNSKGYLKVHIDIMHKGLSKFENQQVNVIQCKDCDSVFTGKNIRQCESNLKIHIKSVHEGERNFSCTMCDKTFWHQWHLRRHVNGFHNKLKYISCHVCGKSFCEPAYLKKHKCRVHKCDFCEVAFTNEELLQRHIGKCQGKKKIKNIAIANPKSPILLTINALIAALFAVSFLYQKPINR